MYLWVFIASWKPTFIEFSRSDVSLLAYISWSKLYYFFCIFDIISSFFLLLAFTVEEVCCIAHPWTSALLMLLELLFLYCLFVKAINCEEKPWLSLYISAKYKMYKPKIISCRRYYWKFSSSSNTKMDNILQTTWCSNRNSWKYLFRRTDSTQFETIKGSFPYTSIKMLFLYRIFRYGR